MTAKITAYTLSRNEAHQIRAVMESLRWAEEIILVDAFSDQASAKLHTN